MSVHTEMCNYNAQDERLRLFQNQVREVVKHIAGIDYPLKMTKGEFCDLTGIAPQFYYRISRLRLSQNRGVVVEISNELGFDIEAYAAGARKRNNNLKKEPVRKGENL